MQVNPLAAPQYANLQSSEAAPPRFEPEESAEPMQLQFPEPELQVLHWADPVLDQLGHDPRSPYAERFWLPVLGPTCLFFLRRLVAGLEQEPEGFSFVSAEWACALGLGMRGGKHGPFWRAVERAERFRALRRNGNVIVVHRRLPPLTSRQVERLPAYLRLAHDRWAAQQLARPTKATIAMWSDRRGRLPPPPRLRPNDAA